jgi:hypothetical protein
MESFAEDFLPEKISESQLELAECFAKKLELEEDHHDRELLVLRRSAEIDRVFRYITSVEHIRLLFLIDLTGSMSSHLEAVKSSTSNLYQKIMRTTPSVIYNKLNRITSI